MRRAFCDICGCDISGGVAEEPIPHRSVVLTSSTDYLTIDQFEETLVDDACMMCRDVLVRAIVRTVAEVRKARGKDGNEEPET